MQPNIPPQIQPISEIHGDVAQVVRACGSYPQCPGFKSLHRHQLWIMTAGYLMLQPFRRCKAWQGFSIFGSLNREYLLGFEKMETDVTP